MALDPDVAAVFHNKEEVNALLCALIDAQVRGWRETGNEWQAWNIMRDKGLWNYGSSLAAQDFAAIEALAAQLTGC